MTARSPSAFALSALLHGSVIAAILAWMISMQRPESKPPVVFDLVAGEGNNYAATVAPALGSSGAKVQLRVPKPLTAAESLPEMQEVPAQPKAPDFTKSISRIEQRKIKRAEAKIKAEREAEARRLSKAEFDRLHGKPSASTRIVATRHAAVPRIDSVGIANGVKGGSTANKIGGAGGKALTREEHSLLDSYFAFLQQRLHDALIKPPGLSDRLVTKIEVFILADGTLTDAQIVKSSGSPEFDQAALDAVARVGSIGKKPDGKSERLMIPFYMRDEEGD
ncbi:MAG: cell envelope integrity protein TolA [Verrucomicrobiota bacterium]|nr:cell envelope integrity protein TolA [Verrucomicrobiota bacterium]